MPSINELKWQSLTASINNIKSPNQHIHNTLYSTHEPKSTEDIELSVLDKARETAPFVRKNSEAIMVSGHTTTFQTVSAPNIRIKRAFTPSELLFGRKPNTVIFVPSGQQTSAIRRHIQTDLQVMADLITNAQELMCCQTLQGQISYQATTQDSFTITFPRSGTHNITLSTFWDDADPTTPRPAANVHTVKRLINDAVGLSVTDCYLGLEAAQAFLELAESGNIKLLGQDAMNIAAGSLSMNNQFNQDGVIFLGVFAGVRFWEYSRTVSVNGVATNLIRSKYAEFVARTPAAQFVEYFGAIPDMEALQGRLFQGERFSKSWLEKDPSAQIHLTHTRPLPVPRRPNATVSMKVVSG